MAVKLEAKDILPDTNHTQAVERAEKCRFIRGDLYPQTRPSEGPNNVFHVNFGANPFSGSRDTSYINN